MDTDDAVERDDRKWILLLKIAVQLGVGLVGGWFAGLAVFCVGLIALSVLEFRLTTRDVLCVVGMIMWMVVASLGAVAVQRYRRSWLPMFAAFALSTCVASLFVIIVMIPFAASMRDFD